MTDEISTYLVIFKQAGEGCDYTIGCGTKVVTVPADSALTALFGAFDTMGWDTDHDYWDEELQMDSVKIVKVAEMNTTLFEDHRERLRNIEEKRQQDALDAAEFAQYKRLQKKYGMHQ